MKNTVINILRILFCIIFASMAIFVFFHPKKSQTNILKAVLSNSKEDTTLINLSNKHSGRFNVIFESDDMTQADAAQKEFLKLTDKSSLQPDISSGEEISDLLELYKTHHKKLLSQKTRTELKNDNYELIKKESLERLYNPMSINLLPLEEDPFLLFSDYLGMLSQQNTGDLYELDGKYYTILKLTFKKDISLSPTLLNLEMPKIIKTKEQIEQKYKGTNIFLTGTPVHTYYASSKSMKEINLICLLSSLFIILICKFYFRSFKLLLPIALSLSLGMLCGYMLTSIFFDSIHILTFVFSSTLIGICVDYSLHYFAHNNDLKLIFKSLTMSMLTTVCAFLILMFSSIELLKQISVFTSGGLFCVYLFVVLFYPILCKNIKPTPANLDIFTPFNKVPQKIKIISASTLLLIACAGLFKISFNDSITDMYRPPKFLANAEALYNKLNKNNSSPLFLLIKGDNLQEILEAEETATKDLDQNSFSSLSKFLPSIKQQKENNLLINTLYKKELNNYAAFLPQNIRTNLLNTSDEQEYLTYDKLKLPVLKDFMVDDHTSIIILQNETSQKLKNSQNNKNLKFIDLKNDISNKIKHCRTSCLKLILPAVLILFAILSIIYKPKNAAKIILPPLLAGLFVIGILSLSNRQINLFHILSLFLIAGFSLDYSIFRYNSTKNQTTPHLKSNWAVLISCATTVFSFFLLAMTSFRLISSLGFILSLGLTSSYILSLVLMPDTSAPSPKASDNI